MKKFLKKSLSLITALLLLNAQTFSMAVPFNGLDLSDDASEIIDFNEAEVTEVFSEIENLVLLVAQNDVSYDELVSEGATDLSMLSSASALPLSPSADGGGPPMGIPSFLWGCVFGIFGLLLVYIVSQNPEQTNKALWGCVIATLVWGVGGFAFY
jgi:hypothetical protein